jgi:serine/threonine protein kinase
MTDQQLSERSIFEAAIDKPSPAERAAYLDGACHGNPALRGEVEALLAAHDRLGTIHLATPPVLRGAATLDFTPPAEQPGTQIGPYKLLEQIGEGGMGTVFVAEQAAPVRRRVALKLIKPGMDTREVLARFDAERQALALMDHPHIARVYDAGTTASGRPYFVMELVRGLPITDYCDQAKLTPRRRLELLVTVCQAIQHAHQKGIIHRDIKPSNVLITLHDGTPVVKVIDFGLAKALHQRLTEHTVYTRFTQLLGTPVYMSPEQAELSGLDVDTRSDVYSLGVLLFELLTGTTPFTKETLRKAGLDELRRWLREEEPERSSKRLSTLGAEERSTTSKRRGVDERQLGQTLRGELDWIALKALEKDRNRRYESASTLAADVQRYLDDEPVLACPPSAGYRLRKYARRHQVPLVTVGLVVAALLAGAGVSIWQAFEANRARQLAEKRQKAAEANLQAAIRAQTDFLALAAYQAGRRFTALGRWNDSVAFYQQGLTLAEQLVHEYPNELIFQQHLRNILGELSECYQGAGRWPDAATALEKALPICQRCATEKPDEVEVVIRFSSRLAALYRKTGRRADADVLNQKIDAQIQKVVEQLHNHPIAGVGIGLWYVSSLCHLKQGDNSGYHQLCAGMVERFSASQDPYELYFTAWTCSLAPDALTEYPAVVELARRAVGLAPKERSKLKTLGAILYRSGQWEEALKQLTTAINAPEDRATTVTYAHLFLAMTYYRLGHRDEARPWFDKAAQATKKMLAEDKTEAGESLPWNRRLTLELLLAEAQALLGVTELAPPPKLVQEPSETPSPSAEKGASPVKKPAPAASQ